MGRLDTPRRPLPTKPAGKSRSTTPIPSTVITYRYNDKMVYVTPADSYQQAVDFAKQVFPELADVDRHRITFSVSVKPTKDGNHVQIGPMAWQAVAAQLARYEILEVIVNPAVVVEGADDGPPQYADAVAPPSVEKQEKSQFLSSRSPSPCGEEARKRSSSRSPSRSPSRTERVLHALGVH
ncbi:hypothetical protein WOLCODRAFT_140559 [Wolfiporia cocos MD-104 SS10]|uniref:Uncharacterized protein n=1 Tax=Wolfiporia cocos (strain MD-104) TaxID=742152 RepID=A0A2H3JA81_WOLCO|nr:hypothetical protein WOLCODRAFT_140559 [Wolfiporia cocos MD-104 SS10]